MTTTKMVTAAAALVLGTLFGTGCSQPLSNDAPILDSVNAPMAVAAKDGTYAIPLTILFHDNDNETVTHVRYRVGTAIDEILEIPAPNPTRQSAEITLVLPASACAKAQQPVELSLLDGRGAESHPFATMVTFH